MRRSELEAALDTEEDGDSESLSEKTIGPLPMAEDSVRGTFDKIMKQKQKGCQSLKLRVQSMLLYWKRR